MESSIRVGVFGCALFLAASSVGAQRPTAVRLPGHPAPMSLDSGTVDTTLPASAGAVFVAARQVFFELKIPAPIADSARGYLINGRFIKLRELAGFPLSTYLNCGAGMTGPNADAFRVTMAVAALIDGTGPNTSRLRLTVLAGAESTEGVSKSAVACGSSGILEERILRTIRLKIRGL
ncbi:MAG TPA: hypothetical protein VF128_04325 [Gemmatimonadaceae bacterium]